jgi:hypothetical protein
MAGTPLMEENTGNVFPPGFSFLQHLFFIDYHTGQRALEQEGTTPGHSV